MKNLNEMQNTIRRLQNDCLAQKITFEQMAAELATMGIVRQHYDCITDELSFYSKEQLVFSGKFEGLEKTKENGPWVLGEHLNVNALEEAIKQVDQRESSTIKFYQKICAAGVVFCLVFLQKKNIYYFDQYGEYYLENYK
ncbi:MAG: hypothetical protein JSS53_00850 [Proteobacteria bacterium]|nr:hypothetical protein [Pseudomonadota bacterium]